MAETASTGGLAGASPPEAFRFSRLPATRRPSSSFQSGGGSENRRSSAGPGGGTSRRSDDGRRLSSARSSQRSSRISSGSIAAATAGASVDNRAPPSRATNSGGSSLFLGDSTRNDFSKERYKNDVISLKTKLHEYEAELGRLRQKCRLAEGALGRKMKLLDQFADAWNEKLQKAQQLKQSREQRRKKGPSSNSATGMPAPKTCTEPDPSESNEAWETGKCEEGSAKTKDKRRENAMRKTSPGSEEATVLPPPESLLQRVCRDMSQTRKYVKMYMASAEAIAEKDKLIETLKSDISFTRMQEMKAELDAYADECSRLSMEVKRLSNHQPQPRVHELEEQVKNLKSVAYFLDKKVKAAQKQERQSMQSFMSRPQSVNEGVAGRARETDKEFPVEKERHSAPLQIDVETENSEAHEQADVCASN